VAFEELDYQRTALGELILQRRRALDLGGREVFEVKLNGEYLMTSLFHEGEEALTHLGLAELSGDGWDVVVGGLGLGYTAAAVLGYSQVSRLTVVEALAPVIRWHQQGLVPNGATLSDDSRCSFYLQDFFALVRGDGFDPENAGHRFDAILLDIDHTPDHPLNPSHAEFYSEEGMRRLRTFLKPGGVFALWSNDKPQEGFMGVLSRAFERVDGHVVEFENPIQRNTAYNGIYIARL